MRLLIIHPNETKLEDMASAFVYDGYEVFRASTLKRAEEILMHQTPDMTILVDEEDDGNALDFFSVLEKQHALPTLVLTRSESTKRIVLLLEYGYQEVLRYPVELLELKARVRTLLRQKDTSLSCTDNDFSMELFGMRIDLIHRRIYHDAKSVQLTSKEFEVLLVLIRDKGQVHSRAELARDLWTEGEQHERNVDVYVRRIRDKLSTLGLGELIETRWGEGYAFRTAQQLYWQTPDFTHSAFAPLQEKE